MLLIVLPQDQIDFMVKVMDTVLKNPSMTIGEIKKTFNLNNDEYNMIYDLCMPLIRETNVKKYWAVKCNYYIRKLKEYLKDKDLSEEEFRKKIKLLAYDRSNAEPYMFTATGLEDMLEERNEAI